MHLRRKKVALSRGNGVKTCGADTKKIWKILIELIVESAKLASGTPTTWLKQSRNQKAKKTSSAPDKKPSIKLLFFGKIQNRFQRRRREQFQKFMSLIQ